MNAKEENKLKILKWTAILSVVIGIIVGAVALVRQENLFFVAESIWAFSIIMLVIYHGVPLYGWKNMIAIMFIGGACSLFFESMGINYGTFFSQYSYTGYIPGPKLFGFDVMSMAGYAVANYIVWAVAQAAVGLFDNRIKKWDIVLVPVVATFLVVAIDLATDPLMATICGAYNWHEPGVYYGIPWQNYKGWYMLGYTMYQLIALWLWFAGKKDKLPKRPAMADCKWFWAAPAICYGTLFIHVLFCAFIQTSAPVTTYSGQTFMTGDIYKGVCIVYSCGLLAPAVTTAIQVFRRKELR